MWNTADSGKELFARVSALPGFGKQKSQIFVALLAKQLHIRPAGWESVAGAYAEEGSFRSVADVHDADSLAKVRMFKQEQKKAKRKPPADLYVVARRKPRSATTRHLARCSDLLLSRRLRAWSQLSRSRFVSSNPPRRGRSSTRCSVPCRRTAAGCGSTRRCRGSRSSLDVG